MPWEDPNWGDWGGSWDWEGMADWQPQPWWSQQPLGPYDYPESLEYQSFDPAALQAQDFNLPIYDPRAEQQSAWDWGGGMPSFYDPGQEMQGGWDWGALFPQAPEAPVDMFPGGAGLTVPFDPTQGWQPGPNVANVGGGRLSPMQELAALLKGREQPGWGSPSTIASLGQLGLGAASGLAGFLSKGPQPRKPTPEELALLNAQIEQIQAQTERTRNPIFPPSGGGGGGGGPRGLTPQELAQIEAQTRLIDTQRGDIGARTELERTRLEQSRPGGAANVGAFKQAAGLAGQDQRFSTLYDSIIKESQGLPRADPQAISQRAQELVAEQAANVEARYKQAEAQILERANRLGENPAGQLAQLQEQKQRELSGLLVNARTQATAEAKTQMATMLERITPSMKLLEATNPAAFADVLARIFGTPAPPSPPGAGAGSLSALLGG